MMMKKKGMELIKIQVRIKDYSKCKIFYKLTFIVYVAFRGTGLDLFKLCDSFLRKSSKTILIKIIVVEVYAILGYN